ncbi:MAG: response regulator [Acidobacteriota bacterium]
MNDQALVVALVAEVRTYLQSVDELLTRTEATARIGGAAREAGNSLHCIRAAAEMVGLEPLATLAGEGERMTQAVAQQLRPFDPATRERLGELRRELSEHLDDLGAEPGGSAGADLDRPPAEAAIEVEIAPAEPAAPQPAAPQPATPQPATPQPATPQPATPQPATPAPKMGLFDLSSDPEFQADLVAGFRAEAQDHLSEASAALDRIEDQGAQESDLNRLSRALHTLKGASAVVGFSVAARLSHALEDMLDQRTAFASGNDPETAIAQVREGLELLDQLTQGNAEAEPTDSSQADALIALVRALTTPGEQTAGAQTPEKTFSEPSPIVEPVAPAAEAADPAPPTADETTSQPPEDQTAAFGGALPALATGGGLSAPVEVRTQELTEAPKEERPAGAEASVRVPLDRVESVGRLAGQLLVERTLFERTEQNLVYQVDELNLSIRRLRGLVEELSTDFEAFALASGRGGLGRSGLDGGEFDELELDRYTEFHLLTRRLAEAVDDLSTAGSDLGGTNQELDEYLSRQRRLLREMQEGLGRLRTVPVSNLEARLSRAVRVTAARTGKDVRFELVGGTVELDKGVLEDLADALLHLVRNAVDHGLEDSDERRRAGKEGPGTVRFSASVRGAQVFLAVEDDGRGIDLSAVREAAVERGLVDPRLDDDLAPSEGYSLLFRPGFSTASEITEISGRGVGLDVVATRLAELRGSIYVESEPGEGTRLVLRLPLTQAVFQAIFVQSGGRTVAVPLAPVTEVTRVDQSDLLSDANGRFLERAGERLPVLDLADTLRLPAKPLGESPQALILNLGDRSLVVLVENLNEARDIAVQPLPHLLRREPAWLGLTVQRDGAVVPILDPYRVAWQGAGADVRRTETAPSIAAPPESSVLIVDDSLSVRRVLANLVTQNGLRAHTAKDGIEALERLQELPHMPDVMLLDIEMPRMDGYELTATVRGQDKLRGLPIIMITSRAGERHRQKALALGVDEYLIKPFNPDDLLQLIGRLGQVPIASAV